MPRFAVLVFPGSNCEGDVLYALRDVLGQEAELVWHKETSLDGFDAALLPGGFAHGDYLRPGAIARFSPIMKAVVSMAESGKPVIGICNGFQVLMEAGLLPGGDAAQQEPSLCLPLREPPRGNDGVSAYQYLRHGRRAAGADRACRREFLCRRLGARRARETGRVMLRYSTPSGELTEEANPNGSLNHIAGIVNTDGNVVGLMPHLDRCYQPELGTDHGLRLFQSLIASVS